MTEPNKNLVCEGLSALEQRVYGSLLRQLAQEHDQWQRTSATPDNAGPTNWIEFLKIRIGEEMATLDSLRRLLTGFDRGWNAARTADDQRQLVLNFARGLGATRRDLKQDEAAFRRWFGADAVKDRCHRRRSRHEQYAAFLLGRLGALAASVGQGTSGSKDQIAFWRWLQLEALLKPLLVYDGDHRLNLAAFRCLTKALSVMEPQIQESAVDDNTLQYIYRSALQHQQDTWIQCAALELLVTLSWASFERALKQRLLQPGTGDDIFVRRRAAQLLGTHFGRVQGGLDLVSRLLSDPSPFVRQVLPAVLIQGKPKEALPLLQQLLLTDPAPEVRAATWLALPSLVANPEFQDRALRLFREVSQEETNDFVLRVICLVAERAASELVRLEDPFLARWQSAAQHTLARLRCAAASVKVRRWASQSLEFIWSESRPDTRALREQFAAFARSVPRGKSRRLPEALTAGLDPAYLGRLWSVISRRDYDLQLRSTRRGYEVIRGHVFGFRWWRWWHEFRHPSPDKRQAFQHTIGRLFDGDLHIPSAIMAELAQTKVPGEPLQIGEEAGWRPYLPLPDQLTSCLEWGRGRQPVRIFSAEGITTIDPPRGWKRWRAAWRLLLRFRDYADKRNWLESMQEPPSAYLQAVQDLGFTVRFDTYPDESGGKLPADPKVERFFPAVALPAPFLETWDRFHDYFTSLYQNSVPELMVFVLVFAAVFFTLHVCLNQRLKHWRKRLPLVIGGWGTRGKSGTERLKAALLNAVGLGVVSKTTGCEAMFLQAYPFGEMKEMFLFRPYDKATIWEQVNVVRLAGRLKTDVMLWECMGLTPAYVRILQRAWMRDDFSTITNTYPDHEDLQGPAGINIPEVIGCFIPEKSTLITSEEQMLPILASEAERQGTQLFPVTWLDAGLIPRDVLQRFPYEEHPSNIALVLALADHLGIDRDFALKEMADRVVPDLGVLKTYPTATLRTRRLEFTNGMSANERFGTLSNWTRTGFDRQDYLKEPGVWLTTVVNNRADRVPRSQVFARVLVEDLSADRHVLIGGNLNGLMGYIHEAWSERAPQISLWKDPHKADPAEGLEALERQAASMRLPFKEELIQEHLRIMLSAQPAVTNLEELLACWRDPEELKTRLSPLNLGEIESGILHHLRHELAILQQYQAFAEEVRAADSGSAARLDQRFREQLQAWFQTKIIVVENYYATGDQIVEIIAQATPPGFLNRVMGIQNIKGTGLDFVYRWQAWQECFNATEPLREGKTLTPQSLRPLSEFQDYGVLCAEHVRHAVERARNSPNPPNPEVLGLLEQVLEQLDAALERVKQKARGGGRKGGWFTTLLRWAEELLDVGDAVRRRTRADRIYEDLIAERISRARAVEELQALTQRQKGGWLIKQLAPRS